MLICLDYGGEKERSDVRERGSPKGKDGELLSFQREKKMVEGTSLVLRVCERTQE